MNRVDVILSQALEDDFLIAYEKECKKSRVKCKYTKITNVLGQGESNPRLGDSVWPQLNTQYIIFCEEEITAKIKNILEVLHKEYPRECAAGFVSSANELI